MDKTEDILLTSATRSGEGCRPHRAVLRKLEHTYVVHTQCEADDGDSFFGEGDYTRDLSNAFKIFLTRCERFGVEPEPLRR